MDFPRAASESMMSTQTIQPTKTEKQKHYLIFSY